MNFYDVLAAEKWNSGIPTTNFFDLLFAQSMGGGEQWQTYEGTLPATINANGDDMRQYQVYGATGGVGDRTENLFNGYFEQGTTAYGIPTESNNRVRSNIVSAVAGTFSINFKNIENFDVAFDFWNGSVLVEATSWLSTKNYITPNNATSARIKIRKSNDAPVTPSEIIDFGMYSGSTAPTSFVPFGYEVDMSVSDGTNTTTTPIYIGDDPLDKDEYIDYQAGKIYRYETEIKKDVSQTGWQWRWETDNVTYQTAANNRVSVGRFYPEETKEYVISAVPDTFEVAVISADSSDVKTADTGWGASWTLSGASAHSFCVTARKSDNSNITPSEVDGVKFKVTSLTPTDPPVPLPALPTCEGETIVDYVGQSVAPEKVLLEYAKGGE